MPVKHRAKQRVPIDLETVVLEHVESVSKTLQLPRVVLLRILVKYGLHHLDDALKCGDTIRWQPPVPTISLSEIRDNTNETT